MDDPELGLRAKVEQLQKENFEQAIRISILRGELEDYTQLKLESDELFCQDALNRVRINLLEQRLKAKEEAKEEAEATSNNPGVSTSRDEVSLAAFG
jgi:hypothetical protein